MSKDKNFGTIFVTFGDRTITWNLLNNEGICLLNTQIVYYEDNIKEVCRQTLTFVIEVSVDCGIESSCINICGNAYAANVLIEYLKELKAI